MSADQQFQSPAANSMVELSVVRVERLLAGISTIADMQLGIGERRTEIITLLVELIDATSASWAWGFADDSAASIAPVASIEVNMTPSQSAAIINMGLDPMMHEEFRIPVINRMNGRSHSTDLRTDLYDNQQWKTKRMYANLANGGYDEWLHSVRYDRAETWAGIFYLRQAGMPPFTSADRQLVNVAMGSIPWFGATLEIALPAQSCVELTTRQRMVLMMQLDGLSRKEIAARMSITVDTVGDHIKHIYEHFGVRSSGELAAIFLRQR